jgi:hypothetical protein
MKYSHQIIIGGIIFVVIGFGLLVAGINIESSIPSPYSTFLGIPYAVNPAFQSSFEEMLALFMFGFLCLGFGGGTLATVGYVVRLEKRVSPPPPSPFHHLRPFAPETIAYYERVVMDNFGYTCPFCYERDKLAYVYGHKSYLSCKACGARWSLHWVFRWLEPYVLAGAKLIQDGTKGTGATLLNKEYPTDFWRKMGLEGGQPPPPPP